MGRPVRNDRRTPFRVTGACGSYDWIALFWSSSTIFTLTAKKKQFQRVKISIQFNMHKKRPPHGIGSRKSIHLPKTMFSRKYCWSVYDLLFSVVKSKIKQNAFASISKYYTSVNVVDMWQYMPGIQTHSSCIFDVYLCVCMWACGIHCVLVFRNEYTTMNLAANVKT